MTVPHQHSNPGPAETPGSYDRRAGAPNHHHQPTGDVTRSTTAGHDASAAAGHDASSMPLGLPDRAVRAAAWTGWHLFEITAVAAPAVVAVTVTPWAWLLSVLAATGWTAHELQTARRTSREPARLLPDSTSGPGGTDRGEVD